jgi:regulator of protease activity HflC (stomatin/prohibitin superfamily)
MRKAQRRSSTEGPFGALCTSLTSLPRRARTAFRPWWGTACYWKEFEHSAQTIGKGKLMEIAIVLVVIAILFIVKTVKVVPQQEAWVVERLGKFHASLAPGLNFVIPFVDQVIQKHSLKEIPLDVPSQVCITRDNTQLQVDGILYFQVTDPKLASYGSSNYIVAVTQLAQTSLRSVIGKLELDKTFEERDIINAQVVAAIDEAALNWGVKVLRYEIKDLTPPKEILLAMQSQITAEREKRALIAASEGRRQEQINIATGEREASIARSEGEKQAAINKAQGDAAAITEMANATAQAIERIALAIRQPGGEQAVQLKVAEQAVQAYGKVAQDAKTTLIVPGNMTEVSGLIASAMQMVNTGKHASS